MGGFQSRASTKRRADYRPSAFLIDEVALEFDLDPDSTRVFATLAFRRNPAADRKDRSAPLALDGERQEALQVWLDGRELARSEYEAHESGVVLRDVPDGGVLNIASTIAPSRNVALEGL